MFETKERKTKIKISNLVFLMFGRDVFEDDLMRQLRTFVLEKGETYNLEVFSAYLSYLYHSWI